jgi:hypothetical protein
MVADTTSGLWIEPPRLDISIIVFVHGNLLGVDYHGAEAPEVREPAL